MNTSQELILKGLCNYLNQSGAASLVRHYPELFEGDWSDSQLRMIEQAMDAIDTAADRFLSDQLHHIEELEGDALYVELWRMYQKRMEFAWGCIVVTVPSLLKSVRAAR